MKIDAWHRPRAASEHSWGLATHATRRLRGLIALGADDRTPRVRCLRG